MKKNKSIKSNIKIHWALMCKSASVDQNTNMLSMFNVIEELSIKNTNTDLGFKEVDSKQKISIPSEYNIVISCEKSDEGGEIFSPELKIVLKDHKNNVLLDNVFPVVFEQGKKRLRTIVSFTNFFVTGMGEYSYIISMRSSPYESFDDNSAEIKFGVKLLS